MKPIAKAPTYLSTYSVFNSRSSRGRKTLMDFLTMRRPSTPRNTLRFKGHANSSAIGIVLLHLCQKRRPVCSPTIKSSVDNSQMMLFISSPPLRFATMGMSKVLPISCRLLPTTSRKTIAGGLEAGR